MIGNYFVLTYDSNKTTPEQLQNIANNMKNLIPVSDMVFCLPDGVSLTTYSKEELKEFLSNYEKMIKGILHE